MKPYKISTPSAHSDNFYLNFFYWLSDWVEILWCFRKCFFKQMLKVSAFYIEKQKSFIPKRIRFYQSISKQKVLLTDPIFIKGFWYQGSYGLNTGFFLSEIWGMLPPDSILREKIMDFITNQMIWYSFYWALINFATINVHTKIFHQF